LIIVLFSSVDCCPHSYRPYVVWYSRGEHEYLLVYSFELKSTFDACQFFAVCGYKRHPVAKVSEKVNRKCPPRRRHYNQLSITYTDPERHRSTTRQYGENSRSYCYGLAKITWIV